MRVIVHERLYYQQPQESPSELFTLYEEELEEENEEPYLITIRAEETPKKLDLGWILSVGMLRIENCSSGTEIILEYQGCSHGFLVPPEATSRLYPTDAEQLTIRTSVGKAKVSLAVFPK